MKENFLLAVGFVGLLIAFISAFAWLNSWPFLLKSFIIGIALVMWAYSNSPEAKKDAKKGKVVKE